MEALTKNITWDDVKHDSWAIKVLDHGFVILKETMGSDSTICESARVSYGDGTKSISNDRDLIRYLMRHRHSTPLEMVEAKFLIKVPMFIWRQWIRHRTANVNELSGRYSILPDEYYVPSEIHLQSKTNNQGSSQEYWSDEKYKEDWEKEYLEILQKAREHYETALSRGMSREEARICLPVSQYTLAYWKCDLHNLMHFLKLRLDPHAQYEIRLYAQAILDLITPKFPIAIEAFNDYVLNAKTFSKQELEILNDLINPIGGGNAELFNPQKYGLSNREMEEFKAKIRL